MKKNNKLIETLEFSKWFKKFLSGAGEYPSDCLRHVQDRSLSSRRLIIIILVIIFSSCGGKIVTRRGAKDDKETDNPFARLSTVTFSRPGTGEDRHQNLAIPTWLNDNASGFEQDRYYIYRSETSGDQNFSANCETECTEWVNTPPECCKVPGKDTTTFTFKGLFPNQTSYFVARASNGTEIEDNTIERNITTIAHPSGMVLVDYVFYDKDSNPYKLYVDYTEAGCEIEDYCNDTGTGSCVNIGECMLEKTGLIASGKMVDPVRPVYPPYVYITQTEAREKCQAVNILGYGTKRLLTWKEFIVASSWVEDPFNLSVNGNQAFKNIEDGTLNVDCNTDDRHGGGNDPVTGLRSFTTGSAGDFSTEACVSHWGAQDMVGNVRAWVDEKVQCYGNDSHNGYCLSKANNIDNAILGWGYCDDDNNDGTCDYTIGLPRTIDGYEYTEANITKLWGTQFNPARINSFDFVDFGITSVLNSGYDSGFNNDGFWRIYSESSTIRTSGVGGYWANGTAGGRFALDFWYAAIRLNHYGFRCALSVPAD